jgi:hypothetical protein
MKYKFRLTHEKRTLAFSNSEETLQRIANVLGLPNTQIQSTKGGPKETIWAGSRTPIVIGGDK